jgi:hypothetical protein
MIALDDWLHADILTLGMAADEARRRRAPQVTYLRVHVVTPRDLATTVSVPEAAAEVRIHEIPASLADAVDVVRALRGLAGAHRLAAFSMADIESRARDGWGPVSDVLRALVEAGLSDVAELPVDMLDDLSQSIRSLAAAGVQPRRVTVSQPTGDRKLEVLERVRACRPQLGPELYFSPLPRRAPAEKPTTGYEDLRMIALARLALQPLADAGQTTLVEVDWSLYGPKLAQVALTFGADHLDSVPATSDAALGPRRQTVADVERNIRAAGFEPQEYRPRYFHHGLP